MKKRRRIRKRVLRKGKIYRPHLDTAIYGTKALKELPWEAYELNIDPWYLRKKGMRIHR